MISQGYLAILLLLANILSIKTTKSESFENSILLGSIFFLVFSLYFLSTSTLPPIIKENLFFHRVYELIPAFIFAVTTIISLINGGWIKNEFEHWLIIALVLGFSAQAFFMVFSKELYDFSFSIALVLKVSGNICVLVGSIVYVYRNFNFSIRKRCDGNKVEIENNRIREALFYSPVGVCLTTQEQSTLWVNPVGARMLSIDEAEDLEPISLLESWESKTDKKKFLEKLSIKGHSGPDLVGLTDFEGNKFWCYLSACELFLSDKIHHLYWLHDSTTGKNFKEVTDKNTCSTLLNKVACNVAHELNTPLGVCLTAATALSSATDEISEQLHKQKLTATLLRSYLCKSNSFTKLLIGEIETCSKYVSNLKEAALGHVHITDELRKVCLNEYFTNVAKSLLSNCLNKNIQIRLNTITKKNFYIYPKIMQNVISKLYSNSSIHGFDRGEVGIVSISIHIDNNENLIISRKDNGKGIKGDILSDIMEPFFAAQLGLRRNGLGLSVVKTIVTDKFNGKIELYSKENKGVMIKMILPKLTKQIET